jgi:signal transduction histidine kinase
VKTEKDLARGRREAGRPGRGAAPPRSPVEAALDRLGALVGLDAGWTVRSATPGFARLVGRPQEAVIGRALADLLAPGTAHATLAALSEAVQAVDRATVPATLLGERAVLLVPVPTLAPSAEIYVLVTDLLPGDEDLSRRAIADVFRARLVEVEEQLTEAALLAEIADDVSAALDTDQVLGRIVDHAARLCRAQFAAVELYDPDSGLLTLGAVSSDPERTPDAPPVPADQTAAGRAIAAGVPVETVHDSDDPRLSHYLPAGPGGRAGTGPPLLLTVPLAAGGRTLGALVLGRRPPRPFEDADVYRGQRLARRAALAIRNARAHGGLAGELAAVREAQPAVVHSEKMAALGRLAAGAAHEINNPLAAIVGNAELLIRREALTPSAQQRAERILQASYRVARIVRQLLAFVRAQPFEFNPTDVTVVLREAVAARSQDLEVEGVRVVDELGDLPAVPADAPQLEQAFANVLDNALDALRERAAEHPRTIRLRSGVTADTIQLRIENSGPPIPDAVLPSIFDPFFTTKEVGRGAGLGLSVCEGIVTAHGGRIRAENLPDGLAMVVELPRTRPAGV